MLGCSFLVFSVYNKNMKTKRIKRILPLCLLLFGCSSTEQVDYRSAKMDLLDSVVFEEKELITQVHLSHLEDLYETNMEASLTSNYEINGDTVTICVSDESESVCQDYAYYEVGDLDYSKSLEELLQEYLDAVLLDSSEVSYFYYNTVTEQEIVYQGDLIMLGASTIKVPLVMAYTDLINEGKAESTQPMYFSESLYEPSENDLNNFYAFESYIPLEFLMHHAIRYSDNSATNMMLVNFDAYSDIPFREWFASFYPMEYDASFYIENQITANLQKEVMKYLYAHADTYASIIEDMEFAYPGRYIKSSVTDFTVAHKWGLYSIYSHDMAIIDTPQPILVGIFTASAYQNGEQIIADMAKIMCDYTLAHL